MNARCAAILVTHCHWDHFLGLAELADGTGAPVWLPRDEEWVFRRPADVYASAGVAVPAYTGDATLVGGRERIDAGGIGLDVVAVPGHSPGHVAYAADGHLFSGDVLFAGGVGRVDLPGGDWQLLLDSIATLVDRFPPDTIVHSGHGRDTTLGSEVATNPLLGELRSARHADRD
jgi:glyoxylase-like metal-dependent hydrolase (beta-lactamase superfamily II)